MLPLRSRVARSGLAAMLGGMPRTSTPAKCSGVVSMSWP